MELTAEQIQQNWSSLEEVIKTVKEKNNTAGAMIENYYLLNNCFLEPNYFFKRENPYLFFYQNEMSLLS
jgi:hypothetical protein